MKTIIKKPHIFFFSLIPLFLLIGFIKTGDAIDLTIYNTFFAIKIHHWCYFSALFVGLIGINYYMLYWSKKQLVQILSLFHIIFQVAAMLLFILCIFSINTRSSFMASLNASSIDYYSILSTSFLLFIASVFLHILNFVITIFKKAD